MVLKACNFILFRRPKYQRLEGIFCIVQLVRNYIHFYSSYRNLTKLHNQTKEAEFNKIHFKLNFGGYNWREKSTVRKYQQSGNMGNSRNSHFLHLVCDLLNSFFADSNYLAFS
jgi:hypothetical protein